jgi:uncharacterized protein YycO
MRILITIMILLQASAWASPQLMVGDLLLQPTDCWSCSLIEEEEETIYSHIGIVIAVTPEIMIAESLGKVRRVTLAEFNKITQKGQKIEVIRFSNSEVVDVLQSKKTEFLNYFVSEFEGLEYDHDFLWNNFSDSGKEKMYCSEMIAKLLQGYLGIDMPVKRMHFTHNSDQWQKYFKGNVPSGQWGNSPADFERSDLFHSVGEL